MFKKLWKKFLLVLLPIAALAAIAILDPHTADIGKVLEEISPLWFLAAAGSMLLYYFMDAVMYILACHYMEAPQTMGESILTTMVGFFYSALTPFASGGQPMQVLQMRNRGIKVGTATSVLILKFLAWQLTITLLGIIGFFVLSGDILRNTVSILLMYIVGFLAFLGSVALAALAFLKPDWVYRTGTTLLNFLERHKLLKKEERIERAHASWARIITDYQMAVQFSLKHRWGMCCIFGVAVLEAVAYMAVTYFIYLGMGFSGHSFFYIVLLQGLLYICVSFVPLPGASIASEGGFYLVFSELFTPAARFPAVLIWRLITYYSALGLGLFAVVIDGLRSSKLQVEKES